MANGKVTISVNPKITITATGTASLLIDKLPAGIYTVEEITAGKGLDAYDQNPASGKVTGLQLTGTGNKVAAFTNTFKRGKGNLYLEKELVAAPGYNPSELPTDTKFSFTCTATPAAGYKFVGWYTSEACTALLTTEPTLILIKPTDGSWAPTTYYAKFEMGVAPLTIERENGEANQVYVYEIQKKDAPDFVIYVTITGNSSVTIPDMPIADYTITQLNDWSWRYDDSAQSIHHQSAEGTIVTFDDNATTDQWLNGNSQLEKNQRG